MRTLATKQPTDRDSTYQKPVRATPKPIVRERSATASRSLSTGLTGSAMLQRQPGCTCGGGCPRCQEEAFLQTKLKISEPGDKYEQEADRVAEQVMRMPEPLLQWPVEPKAEELQRQPMEEEEEEILTEAEVRQLSDALCIGIAPGVGPTRCRFTDRQERRVSLTKRWAWDLASRSALALGSGDLYIVRLARRIFHISRPDVPAMVRILDQIRDALRSTTVECGTCADDICNTGRRTAAAYVPDNFSSIVICPFFFTLSLSEMKRTFLHEAGHVVRIDDRPDYEHPPYCTEVDRVECGDPCVGISDLLHNVDAWARFIECAAYSY